MATFEWGVSNWDVGKDAESLNKDLFGATKKKNRALAPDIKEVNKENGRVQDSDDEEFSKKARKKMKKRLKKTKKLNGEVIINDDTANESDMQTTKETISEKEDSPKKKRKKKKKSENISNSLSEPLDSKEETEWKEKKGQRNGNEINSELKNKDMKEGKRNKRKRSDSQSNEAENDVVAKKRKTFDNDSKEESCDEETGKKRKRPNRKKKNNSKKNKYKHLALNAKLETNVDTCTNKSNDLENSVKCSKPTTPQKKVEEQEEISIGQPKKDKRKSKEINSKTRQTQSGMRSTETSNKPTQISLKEVNDKDKAEKKGRKRKAETGDGSGNKKQMLDKQKLMKMLNALPTDNDEQSTQKEGSSNKETKSSKKNKNKNKKVEENSSNKFLPNDESKSGKPVSQSAKNTLDKKAAKGSLLSDTAKELNNKVTEKLNAARFRYINEQLYTCKGNDAMKLFRQDQEAFSVYHEGFQSQTTKWPVNPLDIIIKHINNRPKELTVADFGCGEARLAESVRQRVSSFDLVALNDRVTACDMSKTPLTDESIDIAVFCLSLMGTNLLDYILEANRVLKSGGLMKVAEVTSRFSNPDRFIKNITNLGFQILNKRELSNLFYLMDFKKVKRVKKSPFNTELKLKPCVYKKR